MLNQRSQQILNMLVEQYIEDGQPVSSSCIAKNQQLGVSPATVRNVMNTLEQNGLLMSPHTSSGRVPTDQGYRVFVDQILQSDLPANANGKLQLEMADNPAKLCEQASTLLTGFTSLTSIVTVPQQNFRRIERIELVRLGTQRLLCVICFEGGDAQNRMIEVNFELTDGVLYETAQLMNIALSGHSFDDGRKRLLALAKRCTPPVASLAQITLTLAEREMAKTKNRVLVRGKSRLLDQTISGDVERLRLLYEAVTDKKGLLSVLDQCQSSNGIKLFIGAESGSDVFSKCSIVSAPYKVNNQVVGVLAVIGPTRMNYRNAISTVDITSRLLSSALNQKNESP